MTGVRFGIQGSGQLVGELPPPALFREVARRAEEVGYDSLWAGDHVSFNPAVPPDRLSAQVEPLADAVVAVVA